jgi:hypothetical protein
MLTTTRGMTESTKRTFNRNHSDHLKPRRSDDVVAIANMSNSNHSLPTKLCNDYGETDVSLKNYRADDHQDNVIRDRMESSHDLLMQCLQSFLPTSTHLQVLSKGQQYTLKLSNTKDNTKHILIDMTLLLQRDVPKLLLSTTVYERINTTEIPVHSWKPQKRPHHYAMMTTMMKFNSILNNRNHMTKKGGTMEQVIRSSYDGKFIYLQHVDVRVLEESKSTHFHRILESFILKSTELCLDFHRIERMGGSIHL